MSGIDIPVYIRLYKRVSYVTHYLASNYSPGFKHVYEYWLYQLVLEKIVPNFKYIFSFPF
ncbi:hypothetical protein Hanom_Chr11g01032601 [Helianthus anomalus]